MKLKHLVSFVLALLIHVRCSDEQKCKRELIDSHNLMSYPDPQKGRLVLCPHIKQSCIPSFEQFKMYGWYDNTIKKHYQNVREVVNLELKMLGQLFKVVLSNMETKVKSMTDEGARLQCLDLIERLRKKKIQKIMDTALNEHANSQQYMLQMKTAYFCVVGDYNSHRYIDITRKRFTMTDGSCDDLVKNTIVYSNAINRGVLPFIENLLTVHQKITQKDQMLRLAGSTHVSKSTKECADQYKIADESLSSCKKYCSYFRLNADSPAFEGYPEFFANVLSELKDYGPPPTPSAPTSRVLGEMMSKMLNSRRRLEENNNTADALDVLDPDQLIPIDLFETNSVDPDFDDAAMIEAFKVQQLLTKGEAFDPLSVVRKHYIDEYDVPMDDLESNSVFNVPSTTRVDVSNFKGEVLVGGIDFPTIIKDLNWNMTVDDIAKALITGKKSGLKEMVDPSLIIAINEIDNAYVKKFHNDPLLSFKSIYFDYRQKQLNQKALDSLNSNVKTVDQTISIVSDVVKSNVDDSAKADKIITDVSTKLNNNTGVTSSTPATTATEATASTSSSTTTTSKDSSNTTANSTTGDTTGTQTNSETKP